MATAAITALGSELQRGLNAAEAVDRIKRFGPNQLQEGERRSPWRILLDQFTDFMILVLMAAAVFSGVVGDAADTIAIIAILLLNAVIGFTQEFRAEKAMAALRRIAAPTATVVRDSHRAVLAASAERGEIVLLAEEELQRARSLEVAEFLFDLYLSAPDLDKARDTVRALEPGDLDKLLVKLRAKVHSLHQEVPDGESRHDARISGIWLAEALVLAALGRWDDMSVTCDHILDGDARLTEALGHLKIEMASHPECHDLRFVLGRCYLTVGDFERAAEQFQAAANDARIRARPSPSTSAALRLLAMRKSRQTWWMGQGL